MSLSEIERFTNDLKLREPLRLRAICGPCQGKAGRGKRAETLVERAVAFGTSEGFRFNPREVRTYLKAKAAAQGEAVTFAYIDGLPAKGYFPFAFFREIYLVEARARTSSRAAKPRAQSRR